MIAREEARLRALFRSLLVLSAAAAPLACSTSNTGGSPGDNGTDATTPGPDATTPQGGADGSVPTGGDGGGNVPDATTPSGDANTPTTDAGTPDADQYGFIDASCDPIYLDGAADGSGCDFFESLPCGLPPDAAVEGCYLSISECGILCNQTPTLQRVCGIAECLRVDASSIPHTTPLTLDCATGKFACAPGVGRRPEGLVDASPARRVNAAGAVLADVARLEAASVYAFRDLGRELSVLRAPRRLVRAAERSAREEIRHARVTTRLARRRGAAPAPVAIARAARGRSLEAFAVENAVEGCVREGFGALVATRQASFAQDPELAREMKRIARDETRHAALALSIAQWVSPRLDAGAKARVKRAMQDAIEQLRREAAATPPELAAELGLPTGDEARALVDGFAAALPC